MFCPTWNPIVIVLAVTPGPIAMLEASDPLPPPPPEPGRFAPAADPGPALPWSPKPADPPPTAGLLPASLPVADPSPDCRWVGALRAPPALFHAVVAQLSLRTTNTTAAIA